MKIYRVHEQIKQEERDREWQERRQGRKERGRVGVLKIHLVCREAEDELVSSLIEYYPLKPPTLSPQAATLLLMAEFG